MKWRWWLLAAVGLVAVVALVCLLAGRPNPISASAPVPPVGSAAISPTPIRSGSADDALALLAGVPVAPDGPSSGYSRAAFHVWSDPDRNGCDGRNDTLRRDLTDVTARNGTDGCVIIAGTLHDPYTGKTVAFAKATAGLVPIDHVVPLALAWKHGASLWDDTKRGQFGNDPDELQTTTRSPNESKGDSGPSTWMPPDQAYHCTYAIRYVTILSRWGLSVNHADEAALAATLASC